jgi:hypothetical protein
MVMTEAPGDDRAVRKIKFNYVKSNLFRVIHTDGATVASTPNGSITINLYSQRFSIPEEVIFDLDEDGALVGEGVVPDRGEEHIETSIIREIDVLTVMDIDAAQELVVQLQNIISQYESED